MTEQASGANGSVFISYSRKDKAFVRKLNDSLDKAGVHAWVDWEGIELASDWMKTISSAIQGTDAFLFVISPDSLKSKICAAELELCLQLNKKLIPILYREPEKRRKMHKSLADTNWVYMRREDNFKATLPKLIESINTDLNWVQQHTKLLGQATDWDRKNRSRSFLLGGERLEEAEHWQLEASSHASRRVLPVQAEFIDASRKYALRRGRFMLFGVSFALALSIILSVFAWVSRNEARVAEQAAVNNAEIARQREQEAAIAQAFAEANEQKAEEKTNLANAQRSAALSQIYQSRPGELDTSTLLAIDSWQRSPSFEAEDLIRSNISLFPLPVARMKQDGPIFNIEWSPDYEYFVTGNKSDASNPEAKNEACVWRGADGAGMFCVEHDDDVTDALFSPDGKMVITASADKSVRFWNAADGALIQRLDFAGAVLDLDRSQTALAIGRADNNLTIYYFNKADVKPVSYEIVEKINNVKQSFGIGTVKFSPNGVFLAFGTTTGSVKFWQANNNFFYNGPKHPSSNYTVLAFSPDSTWLVSGGGDSLSRLTKRDGTGRYSIPHGDWVEDAAFSPDGSWYVTVSDDNRLRVIETESGNEIIRMSHSDFIQKVDVSPDGKWIAATGYDQVVRIWDAASGSLMLEFPLEANGSAISFNKDATRVIAADESGAISIWDISSLAARLNYIEFTEFAHEAQFTPSGDHLVVNTDDYRVWKIPGDQVNLIHDGRTGEEILRAQSLTYDLAISPDSKWAAVVEFDNVNPQFNKATLVSLDGGSTHPLDHGGEVTAVEFSRDSAWAITAGANGRLSFWNIETREKEFDLVNAAPIHSVAADPGSDLLAVGVRNRINIWDFAAQSLLFDLEMPGEIVSLAFSRDGAWLAAGSSTGAIHLWKREGGLYLSIGKNLQVGGSLNMIAFSPDGNRLAGADSSGFAYLWDMDTIEEVSRIRHTDPVTSVSFSPEGSHLITVSRKIVRVWDLAVIQSVTIDELIPFACRRLTANFGQNRWAGLFGEEPYRLICPDLPEGT